MISITTAITNSQNSARPMVNNGGTAGSEDIKKLIKHIQDKVYEDSGVKLVTAPLNAVDLLAVFL